MNQKSQMDSTLVTILLVSLFIVVMIVIYVVWGDHLRANIGTALGLF